MSDQYITPEYIRRAVKKYQAKFKELRVRVLPEEQELITAHAKKMGDASLSAFILRAIHETMERDEKQYNNFERR